MTDQESTEAKLVQAQATIAELQEKLKVAEQRIWELEVWLDDIQCNADSHL